jgi:hypothetical protein
MIRREGYPADSYLDRNKDEVQDGVKKRSFFQHFSSPK